MSLERDQYRARFDEIIQKAKEITLQDGGHYPLLIIEGSKSMIVSQMRDVPDTHGERVELMRFIGQATAKSGKVGKLEQVFFISEGWMSVAKQGKIPDVLPSQDPDHKEVLIVSGLQIKERKKQLRLFEMVRNANNQIVELAELLPPQDKDGTFDVSLLDAFAQGFLLAFQARIN